MPDIDQISGHRVLFVMAAEAEFGPALRARIHPLICGVGPVEAAVSLTAHLAGLAGRGALPDMVVSLGSAGSARLQQGGIYQVTSAGWRDMDASALGFARGVVPFADLPAALPLVLRLPGLAGATISTGGDVVTGSGWAAIGEDMVDMETYAHARACLHFGLPLLGLRGISDGAAELGRLGDWTEALPVIDARLGEVVDRLAAVLAEGGLDALRG